MNKHRTIHVSEIEGLDFRHMKIGKIPGFEPFDSSLNYSDHKLMRKLLTEMFLDGDHDSFMELLALCINHVGKREMAKRTKIPEKTIYNFKDKAHKTSSENIFKIMKAINEV